jgi:hypothetical protein
MGQTQMVWGMGQTQIGADAVLSILVRARAVSIN